jgi:hypothetical protein
MPSLNDRVDSICMYILFLTFLMSISFTVSIVAMAREVYIADHQDELVAMLDALGFVRSESSSGLQSYLPPPVSLMDTITMTEGYNRVSSITSRSMSNEYFVNGSFTLPPDSIRWGNTNVYLIGEKVIDMNDFKFSKRSYTLEDEYEDLERERDWQKIQIIAHVHTDDNNPPQNAESYASSCYAFNAVGAYWKKKEDYYINTANTEGLSDATVDGWVKTAITTWLDQIPNHQVIGDRLSGTSNGIGSNEPDGRNELVFGPISMSGVIAVTITYGIFTGPTASREIIEWDMIINQDDYNFGDASVSSGKMDFPSIAIHEFGHVFGLADIYASSCSHVTMYGYSSGIFAMFYLLTK